MWWFRDWSFACESLSNISRRRRATLSLHFALADLAVRAFSTQAKGLEITKVPLDIYLDQTRLHFCIRLGNFACWPSMASAAAMSKKRAAVAEADILSAKKQRLGEGQSTSTITFSIHLTNSKQPMDCGIADHP